MRRALLALVVAVLALGPADSRPDAVPLRDPTRRSACEGARGPLATTLSLHLDHAAFADDDGASVVVHVPPGFDATRRPGAVVYFHGWSGCALAGVASDATVCRAGGEPRPSSSLAEQLDAAQVNAILVAIELRRDMATGEPGALATPGALRALLQELLRTRLAEPLGCSLDVASLEPVVVIAHSGGYQAAAAALEAGDVPEIREVVLLDALYGVDDVFARWFGEANDHRLIDLYTCCAGTAAPSRALARTLAGHAFMSARTPWAADQDLAGEISGQLERPALFAQVPCAHGDIPRRYVGPVLEHAGFARIQSSAVRGNPR